MRRLTLLIFICISFVTTSFAIPDTKSEEASSTIDITIIGKTNDPLAQALFNTAKLYAPSSIKVSWWDKSTTKLSPHPEIHYPKLASSAAYLCSANHCSLPILTPEELQQNIINATTKPGEIVSTNLIQDKAESVLLKKNLTYIFLAFWLFGVLLAFTPCVLPLILVIAGFLGGHSDEISKKNMILLTTTYTLTLAVTYAIAGICTALFGYYLQASFHKTWVIILASLMFFILSLSMLDFYKIQLPANIRHHVLKFNRYQTHYTHLQVALMAIVATLIASPCLAAPLVGALSFVAKTGNILLGGLALFALGIGISTPLFLATLIGVNFIPKSAVFQQINKTFFGLILFGMAIWLLSNILSHFITMVLWSFIFIYFGVYLYFIVNFESNIKYFIKAISIIILTYGISLFIGALLGSDNPLNPLMIQKAKQIDSTEFPNIHSISDLNNQLNIAKQKNKYLLLYFNSDWCTSCEKLKETVFTDPGIQKVFKQFLLIQSNISKFDPEIQALTRRYNIIGTPAIIFFDPKGKLLDQHIGGYVNVTQLSEALEKIVRDAGLHQSSNN